MASSSSCSFPPAFSFYIFLFICMISIAAAFTHPTLSTAHSPPPIIPSYKDHCSSIVPYSTPLPDTTQIHSLSLPPDLAISHFIGGDRLFGRRNDTFYYGDKFFRLQIQPNCHQTISQKVYMIQASFIVRSPYPFNYNDGNRDNRSAGVAFSLVGFWSEISRKACMVGLAHLNFGEGQTVNLTGVLKLKHANDQNPTIRNVVVCGTFESTSSKKDPGYFDPVSMFAFPNHSGYNYSLVTEETASLSSWEFPKGASLILEASQFCKELSWRHIYLDMLYAMECTESRDKDCSPLGNGAGTFPELMNLVPIQCSEDERKIRYLATFMINDSNIESQNFRIASTLIAEGLWDDKTNQLLIAACRILDPMDHFGDAVGACGIRLTLRYPLVWTIMDNSGAVGQLWSTGSGEDPHHFRRINLTSNYMNELVGTQELRYEYTMTETVQKLCPVKKPAKKGKTYPDAKSYNMRFDFNFEYSKGRSMYGGSATPLFVGNEFYQGNGWVAGEAFTPSSETEMPEISKSDITAAKVPISNISYKIGITSYLGLNLGNHISTLNMSLKHHRPVDINAEGMYNIETGQLCMVGCRKLFSTNISRDCEILLKFEFSPLNARKGGRIKGTIASTRPKGDPLHFEDVKLSASAFYAEEAKESVQRMDLEITLILISNMLFCIFLGLQIFYVKWNPEAVSSISLVMVLILVLGHMIPLILNGETLFLENLHRSGGGWLELNEVTVRVITMVAFLLQIRLLQLVWTAKKTESSDKSPWSGEKKASLVTLLLYTLGALFSFLVWGDLKSYPGLILDGFLLPQVILNAIRGSTEKALSHPFYIGTSAVRLVPRAYNLYRTHSYPESYVKGAYYYANPTANFYSTASDVLIPMGMVAMVMFIFMQQRCGGRCILPRRFRALERYAMVPTADDVW